jgi:transposase-like protein
MRSLSSDGEMPFSHLYDVVDGPKARSQTGRHSVTPEMTAEKICGDVWTFTAIEAQTKLVISWMVGARDAGCAAEFLQDVQGRLSNRIQLTTDGHKMYLTAVPDAFGEGIDYAQLVKIYGNDPEGQKRYSPAQCLGTRSSLPPVR